MKVIELISENFKRLNVQVLMDGKSMTIEGKNGVGKSSFIDAIWVALTGKDIPEQPIKKGEKTARIEVRVKGQDGEEFIVERKFSASGVTLTVKTIDGAKFSSPQKFLDEKIGRISFDPFEFINKQPREQRKFLMDLLGIDLTSLDEKKKQLLTEKEALSKSYQTLINQFSSLPPVEEGLQEKSTADAIAKFNEGNRIAAEIAAKKRKQEELTALLSNLKSQIKKLIAEHEAAKAGLDQLETENLEVPETSNLAAEIEAINQHNERVKLNNKAISLRDDLKLAQESLNAKHDKIKQLEQDRINLIASAKMPIDGLSFSDDGLTFDGLPFTEEQLSTAKLIETGIRISMALNPALRIMRIKDGSLLDNDTLGIIKRAAKENDYQLFIERVSDSNEIGFVIEE